MIVPDGYSEVPGGKLAAVVTCLEMRAHPGLRPAVDAPIRKVTQPDVDWYRDLYARVGQEWLWFSRLRMPKSELAAILCDPGVAVYALSVEGRDEGLLELDFREPGQCELAFYGVTRSIIGQGAGRALMNFAIEQAWARPISRLWVHTCTLDHPDALAFYLRSGFQPYARRIEVADDPRLTGDAPPEAAPHVPVIRGDGR
jgi:GNAT superfamily N-acetyltransferase